MKEEKKNSIATAIYILATLVAFGGFLLCLYEFTNTSVTTGMVWLVASIVSTVFLCGFAKIIDLLDSINNKLNMRSFKGDEK